MAQTRKQKILEEVKRKRKQRTIVSMVIVAVLIMIIGVGVWVLSRNSNGTGFPFPCLAENTNLHVHPWLRIWIENSPGANVSVIIPNAVGILNPQITNGLATAGPSSCFEPLHTHDASGLIHVESASVGDVYHLSDFFNVWKATPGDSMVNVPGIGPRPVEFNQTDILGFRPDGSHALLVLVDGQNSTAYGNLVLNQYDYCYQGLPANASPCYPTDSGTNGIADPYYGGGQYPYGFGHTIIIFYKAY